LVFFSCIQPKGGEAAGSPQAASSHGLSANFEINNQSVMLATAFQLPSPKLM
jgi:hypothetical protein